MHFYLSDNAIYVLQLCLKQTVPTNFEFDITFDIFIFNLTHLSQL